MNKKIYIAIAIVLTLSLVANVYLGVQLAATRTSLGEATAQAVTAQQTADKQRAQLDDLAAKLTAAEDKLGDLSSQPALPKGQLMSTDELLLEEFDWENPEHTTSRATTADEPRATLTVRVVDKEGKPVPMLSCDYDVGRRWTDSKGEVQFTALYNNPVQLSVVNGKSGMIIAGNTDYWVEYRLTVLEGATAPLLELVWEGVTPQQTIDAATNRIEVQVVNSDGNPIKGAELWIERTLKEGESRPEIGIPPELTDEDGIFVWCNYVKENYTLTYGRDGKYTSVKFDYEGGILQKTLTV